MTSRPISRSAGERAPDLTGMKVAHRAMLADTRRFTEIVHRIGAGEACGARRRRAIADYLGLCATRSTIITPSKTTWCGRSSSPRRGRPSMSGNCRTTTPSSKGCSAICVTGSTHSPERERGTGGSRPSSPRRWREPTSCSPNASRKKRGRCSRSSPDMSACPTGIASRRPLAPGEDAVRGAADVTARRAERTREDEKGSGTDHPRTTRPADAGSRQEGGDHRRPSSLSPASILDRIRVAA